MASPDTVAFICLPYSVLNETVGYVYAGLSIPTAFLGFTGSVYLLSIWRSSGGGHRRATLRMPADREAPIKPNATILFCLALSDALACVFVIVKSVALFAIDRPQEEGDPPVSNSSAYWGHPIATMLRYWYQCTFLWTFCYSLDVYLQVTGRKIRNGFYHLVWIAALLCLAGVVPIVAKFKATCPNETQLEMKLAYIPIWILPLLVAMIGSPVFYVLAYRQIRRQQRELAIYTNAQRRFLKAFRWKFLIVILVFYFCWWESVVRIVIIYGDLTKSRLWYVSALLNPLQGFFNAFTYGRHRFFRRLAGYDEERENGYGTVNTRLDPPEYHVFGNSTDSDFYSSIESN